MGCVATFFGLVKAVPYFDRAFPDLLHMLHQAQLVVCGGLGFMFVVLLQAARDAVGFVHRCVHTLVMQYCVSRSILPPSFGSQCLSRLRYRADDLVAARCK